MKLSEIESSLIATTERLLTWRKRRRLLKKAKQKRKNQILDWIQALLWAAVVVLIINQYLLQAYAVPSASMEDTILGEDRLFVDKIVYGPELVPGFGKLPALNQAKRGDIIVFVNPDYRKEMGRDVSGVEELFHRLVYMLTLTIVNLDRTPTGDVAKHFLVKRLIAQPGEQIRMRDGRVEIREKADNSWTKEADLQKEYTPLPYTLQKKFFPYENYTTVRENIVQQTYLQAGLTVDAIRPGLDSAYLKTLLFPYMGSGLSVDSLKPEELEYYFYQIVLSSYGIYDRSKESWSPDKILLEYQKLILRNFGARDLDLSKAKDEDIPIFYKKLLLAYNRIPASRINAMSAKEIDAAYKTVPVKYLYTGVPGSDEYYEDYWHYRAKSEAAPADGFARHLYERRALGWYIPTDRFFPMGDNRDNSKDARWFGAVKITSLLGKSLFRFWPLNRIGAVD